MNLIYPAVLLLFVSCGKKTSEDKRPSQAEQESLMRTSVQPLVKMASNNRGHRYKFKYDGLARDYIVIKERLDVDEESIILSVEGDIYYAYVTTKDKVLKSISRKIQLKKLDIVDFGDPEASLSGDILSYKKERVSNQTGNRKTFTRRYLSDSTINLKSAVCEFNIRETDLEVRLNGKTLTNQESSRLSTCQGTATSEEISALDLKKIEFCDLESKCEPNLDMSYLKNGL